LKWKHNIRKINAIFVSLSVIFLFFGEVLMDRETTSFWKQDAHLRIYTPLTEHVKCDVCVIGAGISGLTTAFLLSQNGKKVIVVDDGSIAGGQTERTTGHLTNALDDRYCILEHYFGKEGAKLAAESHRAAMDFIERLVVQYKIDCEYELVNAYLFNPPDVHPLILEHELQAAQRAGLSAVMVERAPLSSFDTGKSICFFNQAHFHPLKYLNQLCELIELNQSEIYGGTHATAIKQIQGTYTVITDQQSTIQAAHVVIATNSPINSRFLPHLKQAAYRTYVIAANIPQGYVPPGLYYDTLDPYHYIRTVKDKQGRLLLMVGGEDHRTAEEEHIEERYRRLTNWTKERFPLMQEVVFRWSGQILEPIDSLGFIGRAHKDQEIYMITGDSGNGLTHGTLGALLINDLILGKKSPWANLYDPHRKTIQAASDFLTENVNTLAQYRDWLTGGSKQPSHPGCGKIIRRGLKKIAQYRDEKGKLHEMSAVCPHLGAIVRWNPGEHCWECPAHGSRFDAEGKVIQGPANCNLKNISE
jgi:glycine/D-amino acid oxidase-like deaminating enzyme/nitrite reductase/ring-hydroxylating ferredoxin subunit